MALAGTIGGVMTAAAAAITIVGALPGAAVDRPAAAATRPVGGEMVPGGRLRTSEVEPGRYELILSGRQLKGSRAGVEQYLLYRAALLGRQKGATSLSLLYLPGEEGPTSHPAQAGASAASGYGHWQPHWTYYVTGLGWQPWHPEWGQAFWADGIDMARVEKYEVHAIVELSDDATPEADQPAFNVNEVIEALGPLFP
jgi:hypothetical protein